MSHRIARYAEIEFSAGKERPCRAATLLIDCRQEKTPDELPLKGGCLGPVCSLPAEATGVLYASYRNTKQTL